MSVYYNEIDPFCLSWLKELMQAGHIPQGEIDERDIREVTARDLAGFRHCHFFAGIGGWALAAEWAGYPRERELWTGSAPCQPFSVAGLLKGLKDDRHLWPTFQFLISECRPALCFGEQVAGKPARKWMAYVRHDLEVLGYAVGDAELGAASVGAPHIRQRTWWVADRDRYGLPEALLSQGGNQGSQDRKGWQPGFGPEHGHPGGGLENPYRQRTETAPKWSGGTWEAAADEAGAPGGDGRMGDPAGQGGRWPHGKSGTGLEPQGEVGGPGDGDGVGDAHGQGLEGHPGHEEEDIHPHAHGPLAPSSIPPDWDGAEWIWCGDGKYRPVEPTICLLAHGLPSTVGRLRGFGNAIVPQVGLAWMRAYMEAVA